MEIPYEVTARRDTGLWNAKIGIWLFLASEVMLFGGLFSGYVFLRIGVIDGIDQPWPIHVQNVWLGFINTLVLIASSVFVVFAWVSLKERSWKRFQMWMAGVLLCALGFLGIKSYEYYGKFTHYGIELQDGSLMEAEIKSGTDRIRFEADSVTVDLNTGSMVFTGMVDDGLPKFTAPADFVLPPAFAGDLATGEVKLESWVSDAKSVVAKALKAKRAHVKEVDYRNAKAEAGGAPLEAYDPEIMEVPTKATLMAVEPFKMHARTRKVVKGRSATEEIDGKKHDVISFIDGSKVGGKLLSDAVLVKAEDIHQIDLQRMMLTDQREAMVWGVIKDDATKEKFFDDQSADIEVLKKYYDELGEPIPRHQLYSRTVNVRYVHLGHHDGDHAEGEHHNDGDDAHHGESKEHAADPKASGETGGEETDAHDAAHADGAEGEFITIPRDMVRRVSNHGPQYGTYYAIYFTMTGLHGLHVIGGAIVLGYFLFFGKKLFLSNPEHMANRVEVGGLFWHFVDLVWIFLFPIMYLF